MGKIIAVCTSEKKGTPKSNVASCFLKPSWGLEGDAHGGDWHRQVSLLSYDKVCAFDPTIPHGSFGENLLIEGVDLATLPIGTVLKCGEALLEVTQIGKECHTRCKIYDRVGDCIMPREGIFAKVIKEGMVRVSDTCSILANATESNAMPKQSTENDHLDNKEAKNENSLLCCSHDNAKLTAAILTLSDKSTKGERTDVSGKIICDMLANAGYSIIKQILLPDEKPLIEKTLIDLCDNHKVQLVLTTGGTGLSPRDVTP